MKRLLDDAKAGEINTIVVKDLSRFGRNYILVGQYIDYVFPSFGIRFIAIEDRIDTASKDTSAMDTIERQAAGIKNLSLLMNADCGIGTARINARSIISTGT